MRTSRLQIAHLIADESDKLPSRFAESLAAYLISESRSMDLDNIIRNVREIRFAKGYIDARVISAHELSNTLNNDVKKLIRGIYPKSKAIEIFNSIDPTLIGGVIIELPGQRLDLSVLGKMREFKRAVNRRKYEK